MENYKYKGNYMQKANSHGYGELYKANDGNLTKASTIPSLNAITNCPENANLECGFGFGMFQWTFERTASVLDVYNTMYGNTTQNLTTEEQFAAEWTYFKEEISTTHKSALTKYEKGNTDAQSAGNAAKNFRKIYEGNGNEWDDASKKAQAWLKELEKAGMGY